jgi:hypothetical protein
MPPVQRLVLLTLACCGPSSPGGAVDAGVDGEVPGCAGAKFANPVALEGVIGNASDPSATADPLELWFSRTGIVPTYDIAGASRTSATAPFETQLDFPFNSSASDRDPALSGDGLAMVLISDRDGSWAPIEAVRTSKTAPFSVQAGLPIAGVDGGIDLSVDGLTLYFADAGGDLRSATRGSRTAPFERSTEVLAAGILAPALSADELELYYARSDTVGVYRRTRASKAEPFDKDEMLVLADASDPDVSADSQRLYVKLGDFHVLTRACD